MIDIAREMNRLIILRQDLAAAHAEHHQALASLLPRHFYNDVADLEDEYFARIQDLKDQIASVETKIHDLAPWQERSLPHA